MRASKLLSVVLGLAASAITSGCVSSMQTTGTVGSATSSAKLQQQSWSSKVAGAFKRPTSAAAMAPSAAAVSPHDPVALSSKKVKPGPDLYVAMAQVQERSGKFDEAEKQYQKALKASPDDLQALVGYAHLQDRRGEFEPALKLYRQAVEKHPKDASAHNDLGLCLHRAHRLDDASKSLSRAVELQPAKVLYRNNLATVLVEMGRHDEALTQLTAAHGEAVASYNLGYLLTRKGDNQIALHYFRRAVQRDPSMTEAQDWVVRLSTPTQPGSPGLSSPISSQPTPTALPRTTQSADKARSGANKAKSEVAESGAEPASKAVLLKVSTSAERALKVQYLDAEPPMPPTPDDLRNIRSGQSASEPAIFPSTPAE